MNKFILFTALVLGGLTANAQEMTSEEEAQNKREINEIKWNENAVYADVVEYMADDSKKTVTIAQQKSMQLLQTHVIEIFAKRMNMGKEDVQEIWDVIDDKCQNIEVRKGDIVRVFTYIMKDAIGLSRSKPKEKDLKDYFGPKPVKAAEAAKPVFPSQEKVTAEVPAVTPSQEKEIAVVSVDTVLQKPSGLIQKEEIMLSQNQTENKPDTIKEEPQPKKQVEVQIPVKQEIAVSVDTAKAIKEITVPKQAVTTLPVVNETAQAPSQKTAAVEVKVPQLCKTLLEQKDMTTLLGFLDTEKIYERLIYGNYRSMRNPGDCYIVILEKSTRKIVTILGKGKSERMNYVTKNMDNYNNYRGGGNYSAVFVQEL